jgi:hypothetical protein
LPSIDGQGATGLATSNGPAALFGNPAGFSSSKLTFTALSVGSWLHLRPLATTPLLWDLISEGKFGISGIAGGLTNEYGAQGLGSGASATIGLSGKGVGLALSAVTDSSFTGSYPLALTGYVQAELSIVAGFALNMQVLGAELSVGADARPFARIHGVLDNADSAAVIQKIVAGDVSLGVLNDVPTLNGYGLALDTGVQLRTGSLTFGISVRDVGGTRINYALHDFQTVLQYIGEGGLPPTSAGQIADVSGVAYVVPMRILTGVEYHPDLGSLSRYLDPRLFLSIPDLLPVFGGSTSILHAARFGVSLSVLSTLDFYGAIGLDYYAAGIGINLLALSVSVAAYQTTMESATRDSGIAINATLHF